MDMETSFGVVPSQDDLEWVWEDLQDGGLLQDLLLSSVLPSLQKPSAVFVETSANVNSGYEYDNDMTMEMNEWYPDTHNFNNSTSMETSLNVPIANGMADTVTTSNQDYNNYYYHDYNEPKSEQTNAMDFTDTDNNVYPAVNNTNGHYAPKFLPEEEVNEYLNLK